MSDYGDFHSQESYVSGATSTIDVGAGKSGKTERVAIKRFHPPASRLLARTLQLESWRTSMERQQQVAREGGAAVPVLAVGTSEDGEYAVLPWESCPLSIVVSAVTPTGERLRALATGLLRALASWEKHAGRPHGNLKASNVFLVGEGPLAALQFQLTDPAWSLVTPASRLRRQELVQLGAILVQWVRRREAGTGPVENGPEWDRLGRSGNAWREFCNFLLDTQSDPAGVTLELASTRLKAIPTDYRPERRILKIAAGLVVAAGVAVFVYAKKGDPRTMPEGLLWLAEKTGNARELRDQTIPQWVYLCLAWDDWVGSLMADAAALDQNKELWADTDSLKAALKEFRRKADSFGPHALVSTDTGSRSYTSLAQNPPEDVRHEKVVRHIEESWKAVSALRQELEQWWRWPTLQSLHETLGSAGKKIASGAVQPLAPIAPVHNAEVEARPFVLGLSTLANEPSARALSSDWAEWTRASTDLQKSGDRVQAAMPALGLQTVADTSDLATLAQSLTDALRELRRRRALFLDTTVARDRFLKESPLLAEKAPVTQADLPRWEQEVAGFSHLPASEDPRTKVPWDNRLSALQANAVDLEDEAPAADAGGAAPVALLSRASYTQESGRVSADVTALRSRDVLRRELPELTAQTNRVQQIVAALEERLEATLALLRPDRWLAGIAARAWPTDASRQKWTAWQRERLTDAPAAVLEKDRPRFRALRKEERTLRDWLEALNGPDALGEPFALRQGNVSTQRALATVMSDLREKAATAAVGAAEWSDALPKYPYAETVSRQENLRGAIEDFRKWVSELPTFALDLEGLNQLLDRNLSWTEGVADGYTRATSHRGSELLEGDPKRWLQSAQRLRDLASSSDVGALATAVMAGDLAGGLTAWKRLGEIPEWPSDTTQLAREAEFGKTLRSDLAGVTDGPRREKLNTELNAGQRERWIRVARLAVKKPPMIDGTFSQARTLSVQPDLLEPAMNYDLRLWELGHQGDSSDLKQLSNARDGFVAAVRQLSDLAVKPEIFAFLKALDALPLKDDGTLAPTPSPRLAGWREDVGTDGSLLTTSWTSGPRHVTLEYQLIEPAGGAEPFFLARRALAVGEFLDLIAAHPAGPNVFKDMPAWVNKAGIAPGDVISTWQPRGDHEGLELNPTWFMNAGPLLQGQINAHAPGLAPALNAHPSPRSPLQFIPPAIALEFADKVLGARLLTPTEWKSLVQREPKPTEGAFRAGAFRSVWEFASDFNANGVTMPWRPTSGAFSPATSPSAVGEKPLPNASDDGAVWPSAKTVDLWPGPVDDGPTQFNIINLFGNVWTYLYDPEHKDYYVAGGSILTPPSVDVREPQKLQSRIMIGRRGDVYGDGFTDVGLRAAFDAPASLRQRLQFSRLVKAQTLQ